MRTFITSIIALFCLTMISCSDNTEMLEGVHPYANTNNGTRADGDNAYVRVGMYANIEGFKVRISNIRINDSLASISLPKFGSAITNAEYLPSSVNSALFDNANGEYNAVAPTKEAAWVVVRFDVEILSASTFESEMVFQDVRYCISPDQAKWISGNYYDYVINVNDELLDLSSIEFSAEVEDFENECDIDFNI